MSSKNKQSTKVTPKQKTEQKSEKPKFDKVVQKSDKVVKKSEKSEKSEKPIMNKLTTKVNLNFNVNAFRTWLKKYYEHNELYAPKSKPKDTDKEAKEMEDHVPKFKGAHVALAAATEVLCNYILKETVKQLTKGTNGLYDISRAAIKYTVTLNENLEFLLSRSLTKFEKDSMYDSQFCIPHKEMTRYIDLSFGKNISLDNKAHSMLIYLLLSFCKDVARHIFNTMTYANKRSLDFGVVMCTIKNLCNGGDIEHDMVLKIEDTKKLCNEDDEEDESENPKNKNPKKPETEAIDDGDDDNENMEIEGDEEEEEEDEEEEDKEEEDKEANEENEETNDDKKSKEEDKRINNLKEKAKNPPRKTSKN